MQHQEGVDLSRGLPLIGDDTPHKVGGSVAQQSLIASCTIAGDFADLQSCLGGLMGSGVVCITSTWGQNLEGSELKSVSKGGLDQQWQPHGKELYILLADLVLS
ncbi:hypothetical protein Bbelb_272980 [Branchiostoma belcheri]|nr:hypothetical protein Bbelb_272980 [Branchiostoma belcheri]